MDISGKWRHRYVIHILLLCNNWLCAQSLPYRLYTPHDGLPQSQIISIFQDSRGYIWVGTHSGLAYFDGAKFHSLTAKDGLPYAFIPKIQEDQKGNILFYAGKWLCQYDGRSVSFDTTSIRFKESNFGLDENGTIWAISAKDNLLYFSQNRKDWKLAAEKYEAINGITWHNILWDKQFGRLLLLSTSGDLYAFKGSNLTQFKSKFYTNSSFWQGGFAGYGFREDSIFHIGEHEYTFLRKGNGLISSSVQNKEGNFYFINRFDKYLHQFDQKGQTHTDSIGVPINFLFLDHNDNLWIATEAGLMRVFTKGFENFGKAQLDLVWSMAEDNNGNMWFGEYYSRKLKKYDGKTIKSQQINYSIKPGLAVGGFSAFYFGGGKDKSGNLYFSNDQGILKYDGKKFYFFDKTIPQRALSFNLYVDTLKNILVSGTIGGVNVIDIKSGAAHFLGKNQGLFMDINVLGVTKDGMGNYWLGTGIGLAVLNTEQGKIIKNYTPKMGNFPYYGTSCIFGDFQGNIWAGSAKTLLFHDIKQDTFVEVAPNIIHSGINCIAGYKNEYLVVGANDGVYFIDLKAFYGQGKTIVRYFNQYNGYTGIEPNQNCLFAASKGNVWVAASDIVTKITPSELSMESQPLRAYITEINNERVRYEDYGKRVSLPDGSNTAKIRFESVGFERPWNAEYSYKVDGGEWSAWRTEDFAILDNLSSGVYTFYVKTRQTGMEYETDEQRASIQIKVTAPLLKEWWFPWVATTIVCMILGLIWIYLRKVRQNSTQQAMLYEEQARERTRQNKYLQIQTLQAQLNPHFIFNVLQAVQTRIYEGNRESASSLIVDLGNLMRRFLESSVNMDMKRLRNSEITLREEINLLESYIQFEQLQYSSRFDYAIRVEDELEIENTRVPPMLIQPYVENAIKHGILYEKGRCCHLEINFSKTKEDRLVIVIMDDGVGRDKAREIQQTFIRMYKSRGTQILEDRIKIMQELGHNINAITEDRAGGGTVVTLTLDM